jgi:hypothetical protein
VAFVPEGAPHVGAEALAGFFGERGAFGDPALVELMVELFPINTAANRRRSRR